MNNGVSIEMRAVLQFYQQSMVHPQIHEWLTKAQISTEAWSFSWELMGSHKTAEVQYFGANSLHVKISRFWHEVPPDQYDGLRSRLLDKIIEFGAGPKIVLTRLCVALSQTCIVMKRLITLSAKSNMYCDEKLIIAKSNMYCDEKISAKSNMYCDEKIDHSFS
ncbi:unnamed protein product [Mytilus edulis]|uniref:Importin N-terminal domain-containing protein n=1 Tax=Mytilus edulis TaxID=6550 RepID=A0A8S3TMT2_MYTED|nr:unnamed protein product [Mytilus edulis]